MAKPAATAKKTKPLSKAETLKAIAHAVGDEVSPKHVKAVVEHLVAVAHKELKKTGTFVLHGLAKFTVHKKPQSRRHLVTNRRARYSEGPCAAA